MRTVPDKDNNARFLKVFPVMFLPLCEHLSALSCDQERITVAGIRQCAVSQWPKGDIAFNEWQLDIAGRAGSNYSGLIGEDHELGPVACPELHHGPGNMGLDRGRAHVNPPGDLLVC